MTDSGSNPLKPRDLKSAAGPLAHIPLFSTLNATEQQQLRDLMHREHFEPNQTIFWFGDLGKSLYLVSKGEVEIQVPGDDGIERKLSRLGPGGFFGELGLLDGGPRTATVRAVGATEVFVLSRDHFHAYIRANPDAAVELLTVMGQRSRVNLQAIRSTRNPNEEFERSHSTLWQHVSDFVATVAASQWFTIAHLTWFSGWISWNLLGSLGIGIPPGWTWDVYPFGLLTMIVSLEAIFLSIFVLVSQNRQAQKDRLRVDIDHQVNVKAQSEIMGIARHLERLESMIRSLDDQRRG